MFFKFEERVSEERCRKDGNILSCTDALTPAPQSKHVHSSQYCYVTLCFIYKTVERVHSPVFKKHLVLESNVNLWYSEKSFNFQKTTSGNIKTLHVRYFRVPKAYSTAFSFTSELQLCPMNLSSTACERLSECWACHMTDHWVPLLQGVNAHVPFS